MTQLSGKTFHKHGLVFPIELKKDNYWPLYVELLAFRKGMTKDKGGLGKQQHFINICSMLWPTHDKSPRKFFMHPWAVDMLDAVCTEKYVGVMGCGSSGKTDFFSVWGIVNFMADPVNTTILTTSTSLKDARQRIWGRICDYWLTLERPPGKLLNSMGTIRMQDGDKFSERSGITLIAGSPSKEKEAVAKMIGFKNKRMILIADELPELSEAIVEAALSNLALNEHFQLVGLGNPKNHFDPMARLTIPANGDFTTINVDTGKWKTKLGVALHFDGLKSPNVVQGRKIYPGIIDAEKVANAARDMGEQSSGFWRMIRGFYCPTGEDDSVYSDIEITSSGATQDRKSGFTWLDDNLIKVAALDPSFTNGGDDSALIFGTFGTASSGKKTLLIEEIETITDDVTITDMTRSQQVVKQFREKCEKRGVAPRNAAYDNSGGGKPFGDWVDVMWSSEVLRVDFGGASSELPVSAYDKTPSSKRYVNRVTEIWYGAKEYFKTGQIKGITPELANEMCLRKKTEEKGINLRMRVESKREMKGRMDGKSPDKSDAFFILLMLCKERLSFNSSQVLKQQVNGDRGVRILPFKTQFRNLDSVNINE